jgi:hypothetical protein
MKNGRSLGGVNAVCISASDCDSNQKAIKTVLGEGWEKLPWPARGSVWTGTPMVPCLWLQQVCVTHSYSHNSWLLFSYGGWGGHDCVMLSACATHAPGSGGPSVHNLPSGRPQGFHVKGIGVSVQRKQVQKGKEGKGKGKGKHKGKHKAPACKQRCISGVGWSFAGSCEEDLWWVREQLCIWSPTSGSAHGVERGLQLVETLSEYEFVLVSSWMPITSLMYRCIYVYIYICLYMYMLSHLCLLPHSPGASLVGVGNKQGVGV